MTNFATYAGGEQLHASTVKTETSSLFRSVGNLPISKTIQVEDTGYRVVVQVAAHSGSGCRVGFNYALSAVETMVTEGAPLVIELRSDIMALGDGLITLEPFGVNNKAIASLDIAIFYSENENTPVTPVGDAPWLVLDASTGVSLNIASAPVTWEDTRDERNLTDTWTFTDTEFIESDPDFNGAPSLVLGTDGECIYDGLIDTMVGDASHQFMRGDADWTMLAVAMPMENYIESEPSSSDNIVGAYLFAAADESENPLAVGFEQKSRPYIYGNNRYGLLNGLEDFKLNPLGTFIKRKTSQNRAQFVVMQYDSTARTLSLYSNGEWSTDPYVTALTATDFTTVPRIGNMMTGDGTRMKVNHVTIWDRLLSNAELTQWKTENAIKVEDTVGYGTTFIGKNKVYIDFPTDKYETNVNGLDFYEHRSDVLEPDQNFRSIFTYPSNFDNSLPVRDGDALLVERGQIMVWDDSWTIDSKTELNTIDGPNTMAISFVFLGTNAWTETGPVAASPASAPIADILTNLDVYGGGPNGGFFLSMDGAYGALNSGKYVQSYVEDTGGTPVHDAQKDPTINIGDHVAMVWRDNGFNALSVWVRNITQGYTTKFTSGRLATPGAGDPSNSLAIFGPSKASYATTVKRDNCASVKAYSIGLTLTALEDVDITEWFDYLDARYGS